MSRGNSSCAIQLGETQRSVSSVECSVSNIDREWADRKKRSHTFFFFKFCFSIIIRQTLCRMESVSEISCCHSFMFNPGPNIVNVNTHALLQNLTCFELQTCLEVFCGLCPHHVKACFLSLLFRVCSCRRQR